MNAPRFYDIKFEKSLYREKSRKIQNSIFFIFLSIIFLLLAGVIYKGIKVNKLLAPVINQADKEMQNCFSTYQSDFSQAQICYEWLSPYISEKNEILRENYCLLSGSRWRINKINGNDNLKFDSKTFPICLPFP